MPVLALKASSTFWKFSCSAPPHRDVTVISPPAVAEPPASLLPAPVDAGGAALPPLAAGAAGVAPPLHAAAMKATERGSARILGNLAIGLLLLADGGRCLERPRRPLQPSDEFPHRVGQPARPLPGLGRRRSSVPTTGSLRVG